MQAAHSYTRAEEPYTHLLLLLEGALGCRLLVRLPRRDAARLGLGLVLILCLRALLLHHHSCQVKTGGRPAARKALGNVACMRPAQFS